VRNAPHRRRIHGAAEMHMKLSQFISERVRHVAEGYRRPTTRGRSAEAERVAPGSGLRASR